MIFAILSSIPIPTPKAVEQVAVSEGLKNIAIFAVCMIICMAVVLYILNYIMQLKLKPVSKIDEKLDVIQNQYTNIMSKIKSGEDLERMIKFAVMEHERDCPKHNRKQPKT